MAENVETLIEDTIDAGINDPRHIGRSYTDTVKNVSRGNLKEAAKSAAKGGFGVAIGVSKKAKERQAQAEAGARQEAVDKQAQVDADLSAKDKAAKTKAAQERLARRRSTPGRPIFTPITERESLL